MAEFCDVMRQAARMCMLNAQAGCCACPLNMEYGCKIMHGVLGGIDGERPEDVERIVMDWAAKNPEPRYPSWAEWQKANFPNALHSICPNYFMAKKPLGTCATSCARCTGTPIPADIAEKLGIKLIGAKNDG